MDIFVIDDEKSIRQATEMAVEAEGHYAEGAANLTDARRALKDTKYDLIFLDLRLGEENGLDLLAEILEKDPNQLVVIFTAYATVETAVKATKLGAFDYLSKPFSTDQIRGILVKAQKAQRTQKKITKLETTVTQLKTQVDNFAVPSKFESQEEKMQTVFDTVFRAANSMASILILGESGTGKSVIAKAAHERSQFANKPFVTVSCPSLSKELLESELFGHTKGSFTGAVKDKWGKVHEADGGTLFLDEIGELPMEIQPKLLRLLQEREYERLGENKTRKANVRIIAATNKNLEECIENGDFREDLYYRINVISVTLPSLRERPSDLAQFAKDYLKHFSSQVGRDLKGFSNAALKAVLQYPWPGNLRELRNSIERASILSVGDYIEISDLPEMSRQPMSESQTDSFGVGENISIAELEAEHIKKIVDRVDNLQDAAEILGIDKATLYRKRKKLNIE